MRNKVKILFIIFFSFTLLLSCSQTLQKEYYDGSDDNETVTTEDIGSMPNRKIIYNVKASITTDNLSESIAMIKNELNSDEWLDSEDVSLDSATLLIRVKSDHLDEFLNAISQNYEVSNFNKTATDISLLYQDKSNLVLTYQKERERLLELYDNASLSDMIQINTRLSQIDIEIGKLQGELNKFDSLVDYSEVRLNIYTSDNVEKLPFGEKISNSFSNGFKALISFFEILVIVIAALAPWMVVILPIVYVLIRYTKHSKKKKPEENKTKE